MTMLFQLALGFWLAAAAPDPAALEREAKAIEGLLIAPCCWSQQVSLHQSPAADDIKQTVRKLLAEGKTSQQILDIYVAQYGDRILAEPPARGFSRLIYVAPWIFLVASVGLVVVVIRTSVRQALADGRTRQQILDGYVAQYGDRILAEPPARGFNLLLYVGPWLFLAGSVGLVVLVIRKLRVAPGTPETRERTAAVNEAEAERIDEELRNLD
jgi:cytochrome c-type biogenesis protein CcmH